MRNWQKAMSEKNEELLEKSEASQSAPCSHAPVPLSDMHCHLDFISNANDLIAQATADNCHIFANTVTPQGFTSAQKRFVASECVHLGLGLHPWYIESNNQTLEQQLEEFQALIDATSFIGEVGLDFSKRKIETADLQTRAFTTIAQACGQAGSKLLSIHAIKSADTVLDILEHEGVLGSCTCIFHWFSGSNEQLRRAINAGCYFSVGPFMANSRRGKEYIKVIPCDHILLETDYPPTAEGATYDPKTGQPRVPFSYAELKLGLLATAAVISERKGSGISREINETVLALVAQL